MSFPSSLLSPYLLAGKLGAEQAGAPDAGSNCQGCCGSNITSDGDMDMHGTQGDHFTSCMNQPSGVTPSSVSDKFVMLAELALCASRPLQPKRAPTSHLQASDQRVAVLKCKSFWCSHSQLWAAAGVSISKESDYSCGAQSLLSWQATKPGDDSSNRI